MMLHEKHRPRDWSEVVGQDKAIAELTKAESAGQLARHWWIAGKSGCGKTTLARIIANKLGHTLESVETTGRELTANDIRAWRYDSNQFPMYGKHRVYIVNEAQGMSKTVVEMLLDFLENSRSSVVLFTTTTDNLELFEDSHLDAHPLRSRCRCIALESQGLAKAFSKRIASKTGLDESKVYSWFRNNGSNMREAWQAVEAGSI